ncbi:hypothetical protein [Stenotrophomonas tumulicola]|uniref:Secreted protein n=1 Tax=Stenotrophomonas tumulicola TaxID=1685415 RepID=A0A7W3FPY2_9GAMM|nr:hypothetical protein [Stenotrophomonas tumulicola]MBA8683247.1 hypothetical protein [Stenotrophomonas tumulicola]
MSLPSPRLLACTLALLALPLAASAQRVVDRDLQQEMSPSEFKAAGLDKLSADELSRLNHWLQGTVEAATTQAVEAAREEGRQEVIVKNRGFFDFGSREPITSVLPGAFNGFAKGRIYMLANGQHWEQTDAASLGGVRRLDPEVSIAPGVGGAWYLQIPGVNTRAKVKRVK